MVWKMYVFSNMYQNRGWWTEIRIANYELKNVCVFKQASESWLVDRNKNGKIWFEKVYVFSNRYQNPGWWTEIRIVKSGLENESVFKQVSESGLVDRNRNSKVWFGKCMLNKYESLGWWT